jgi:polysaccharide export outer membrane protein
MASQSFWVRGIAYGVWVGLAAVLGGCHYYHDLKAQHDCCCPPDFNCCNIADAPVPKELVKVSMPPYVVETPDILQIEAIRVIPLPPYRLEPLDIVYITAQNVFESAPLNGLYPIDIEGNINLGAQYGGAVRVVGLSTEEAQRAVENRVRTYAAKANINVSLAQSRGVQAISGQHIVRPDGTISLGTYGSVYVAGLSLAQAKQAIEAHLSKYLYRPEVSVDVYAYNSKFYYVITDFAGAGEQVARLPHTGNETVLDAISLIGGLSAVSGKKIWVARPAPTECGHDQILPVDWCGITRRGEVKTNYQVMPFDRIYILSQPLSKLDTYTARVLSPINRVLNSVLLGAETVQSVKQNGNSNLLLPIGTQ